MRFFYSLLGCIFILSSYAKTLEWQTLAPGIDYTAIHFPELYVTSKLHALRIDPKRYQLNLLTAQDIARKAGLVTKFAQTKNALIVVNGGFFNSDYQSLGLRINRGHIVNPIKSISWWDIFVIEDDQPKIISTANYQQSDKVTFAIQAGPRLLIDGKIPKLKDKADLRSALCITPTNQIIIAVTEHLPLTTTQLANILRKSETKNGLNCKDALNLDGGHSSQLYVNVGTKKINVPNLSPVADVIIIKSNLE